MLIKEVKSLFVATVVFCIAILSLSGCNKIKRLRAGDSIYGAFATGILSGVIISLQPGIGTSGIDPMQPLPKSSDYPNPSEFAQALQTWLERPANFCPKVNDEVEVFLEGSSGITVGKCLNFQDEATQPATIGNTLLRGFYLCQYEGMDPAPWLSLYQLMHFETNQDCENFRTNQILADGKEILLTYGNGRHGHQQNRFFSSEGNIQFIYSDFISGWNESKSGGVRITYNDGVADSITIEGVQIKNFIQKSEVQKNPRELFKDLENSYTDEIELKDDLTFSSVSEGKRSSFSLSYSNFRPQITDGEVQIQDNKEQALMTTRVSSTLNYSDPTCCWPMGGQVTTTASNNRNFREDLSFSSRTCGEATLTRISGSSRERQVYQLDQCF